MQIQHVRHAACLIAASMFASAAGAATTVIPQSALTPSTSYYTDTLGPNIVTTGGGNAANVGGANGRNDDGYMALNLGFDFTLFGNTYNSLFINNNGNLSFGNGISAYVPTGPTGANAPVISAWFGDVDTRNPASGLVHYNLSGNELVVTWDDVGYYDAGANALNAFQIVLRSDDYVIPVGQGQIGFFYKNMGWESTNTSRTAAVGFGDGAGNSEVLEGSTLAGLNRVVANHNIWFDQNLAPVTPGPGAVPEPATWAMMILGFGVIGAGMRRRRVNVSFA
jgi:hypothetical protein